MMNRVLLSFVLGALVSRTAIARPTTMPAPEPVPDPETIELSVGGYVEAYYQVNARLPSNHLTNLRGFDNRERTFTLSNVALDARAARGPVTTRVVLQLGSTPSTYYLAEPALPGASGANATGPELWKYIQQATVAYTAASGLVVDAGLFPSPIGPEVIPVKDNWNWSRSDLFFGLPFYHTGVRAAVPLGGGWTGMLHAYSGWNSVVDNNAYPSVGASAAYAGRAVSGQVLYLGGVERSPGAAEGTPWRHLLDAYATVAVSDQVSVLAHVDGGIEPNDLGTSGWLAGALYAKVALAPALYAAARADYFREWVAEDDGTAAAAILWPTAWIASGTATLAYQPTAGLSVRFELRHDHAKTDVFFGGDVGADGAPNRRAQDTATLGVTGWF